MRRGPQAFHAALALACVGAMPSRPVRADVLTPKSGPKVSGLLVRRDEQGIVFNPYWSPNPEMTWEVIKLPASGVKKVDVEPHPEPEVMRRLQARAAGDVAAAKAVAAYAKEHKLKAHAEMAWALALADKADDAEALAGIGGAARWEAVKHGNVALDPALREALARYVAEADPKARLALQPGLKAMGFVARSDELERYRRGAASPKGYFEDVPLSLHADKYAAAVYTLFVPDEYEPTRPWPLLIGLHGGGPDGKDGDEVVGSGPSAMNFYRDLASKNGVIVACPTAQTAGWGNKVNEELVKDVIAEVRLLYDVDVDRIHLTGHSMGGYGTWALGPRMADLFATISPMAGNGDGNVQPLVDTKTPIFIYHSADDFIPVAPERAAAKKLRETDLDFVYTELDGQGHGCPESIRAELFAFLLPRRNFDPAYKEVWPRSSFLGKVTPEEKAYLGDPLAALEGKAPGLEDWLAWLRLSGGRARAAATAIGEAKPASAVEGLVRVLKDEKAPAYGRAEAARGLGLLGDASSAAALRHAVAVEARRDTSVVSVACARALVALKDAGAAPALGQATQAWAAYFESKRMGPAMRFSDWERSVGTLAAVVGAWADLGGAGAPDLLDRSVVAKVFAAGPKVETSERVPQDPSVARSALATSVARAYAAAKAPPARWTTLLAALATDEKARAAAEAEKAK